MYSLFRDLAIIILSAKFFGLLARKCKAPQVVGEIIAGLLIGPCVLNLVQISDSISIFAEIGVVMLMFTTGLGTNLKELIKAGPIATLIATVGVAVPLVGGTLLYGAFYGFAAVGSPEFYRALFIGTIMTATSVSITVATLQELGHLKSFLGTTIVSAAVIDDVIGIVVLTCVLGASSGTGTGLGKVLFNTVLFFATALGVGLVVHYAMKWLDQRNPHTQRITIVSMAFCFAMAYIAEEYFGIADITGAYIAGIVRLLCGCGTDHQDHRLRSGSKVLPLQLGRFLEGRCRHDDPRRGGTDRGTEGSGYRRGRSGLLYRRDPADRGVQRGYPAGTQGDVHQASACAASQSGKLNQEFDFHIWGSETPAGVLEPLFICKNRCKNGAAAHGFVQQPRFYLRSIFTASCRTPSGRRGTPRRSQDAAVPAPPAPPRP